MTSLTFKFHTLQSPWRWLHKKSGFLVPILGGAVVLSIVLYMYAVLGTTVNVVERKNLETEIRSANGRISELELSYFKALGTVTVDHAHELGFSETKTISFVTKGQGSNVAFASH